MEKKVWCFYTYFFFFARMYLMIDIVHGIRWAVVLLVDATVHRDSFLGWPLLISMAIR
jgi:hypothetical protein